MITLVVEHAPHEATWWHDWRCASKKKVFCFFVYSSPMKGVLDAMATINLYVKIHYVFRTSLYLIPWARPAQNPLTITHHCVRRSDLEHCADNGADTVRQ